MADAVIDVLGVEEIPQVVELYNEIFRPARTAESFERRYLGRHNVLQMVARVKDRPVGFFLGFELKPGTFFAWFHGVLPDYRRAGIGSQLMEAAQSWAAQHDYEWMRLECQNQHRPGSPEPCHIRLRTNSMPPPSKAWRSFSSAFWSSLPWPAAQTKWAGAT